MPNHGFLTSEGYNISLVVDFGSSFLRSGYNTFPEPGYIFPPISSSVQHGTFDYEFNEALMQQDYVHNSHIDDCALLANFTKSIGICDDGRDTVGDLSLSRINFPKISDSPLTIIPPRHYNRNSLCELLTMIFSETYHESVFLVSSSSAHLFSAGKTTGMVIDCGASITSCTAVFEGYPLYTKEKVSFFGGFDVTRLTKLLYPEVAFRKEAFFGQSGAPKNLSNFGTSLTFADEVFFKGFKSNILEVFPNSCEWTEVKDKGSSSVCTLPDGNRLEVGNERYFLSEHLFTDQKDVKEKLKTALNIQETEHGFETLLKSVHLPSMVEGALFPYDYDLQEGLKQTIVTCGGGLTSIKNLNIRLKNELCSMQPESSFQTYPHTGFSASTCISPSTNHSAWVGAAILSAIPDSSAMSITRKEVDEFGPARILEKKFP